MQIQRAIGTACNTPANKISLFSLCDMSTEFWGIRFEGNFEKRTKEGDPWNGKGEMFFMPELRAGVVSLAKNPQLIEELNGHADAVKEFVMATIEGIQNRQNTLAPSGPTTAPAATGRTPNAKDAPVPADIANDPNPPSLDDLPF
jgi:hypothetical protein